MYQNKTFQTNNDVLKSTKFGKVNKLVNNKISQYLHFKFKILQLTDFASAAQNAG